MDISAPEAVPQFGHPTTAPGRRRLVRPLTPLGYRSQNEDTLLSDASEPPMSDGIIEPNLDEIRLTVTVLPPPHEDMETIRWTTEEDPHHEIREEIPSDPWQHLVIQVRPKRRKYTLRPGVDKLVTTGCVRDEHPLQEPLNPWTIGRLM